MKLKNKLILAPMVDVSDASFRILCSNYGASLTFVEMLSSTALARNNKATLRLFDVQKQEKPIGVQFMGNNSEDLIKAIKIIEDKVDIIDLNLGCPVPNIVNTGAGVALMKRPSKVKELVSSMVSSTNKPISVKMRTGWDKSSENFLEIGKICEDVGVNMITLHARTKSQAREGNADWSKIKLLKEKLNIPVIGNGDLNYPEDIVKMINDTNCDYVMVARAAARNPYLFKQTLDYMERGKYKEADNLEDLRKYLKLAEKHKPNFKFVLNHAMYMTRGAKGGAKLRANLSKCKTIEDIRKVI